MGLKETVNSATLTAFKTIGNLNITMIYNSFTGEVTRDNDAGTSVAVSTPYTMKYGTFTKWTDAENDKLPNTNTTSKFIFPLSILAAVPKTSDTLTDPQGHVWEIVKVLHEPSDSLGKLQVRTSR